MSLSVPIIIIDRSLSRVLEDSNYPSGGTAVQLLSWVDGFIKNGISVKIVCDKIPEKIPSRFNKAQFIELENIKRRSSWLQNPFYFYWTLIPLFKREKSIFYQSGAGILTFIIALFCRIHGHIFIHRIANDVDTDERIFKKLALHKALLFKLGIRMADILVCQNSEQAKKIDRQKKYKDVIVLRNPYVNFHDNITYSKIESRTYFAWVGIFHYQKNLSLLFDIANELRNETIHIAGIKSRNIDSESLKSLKELEKLPNVTFRGFIKREEMNKFYSNAIALINTSRYEGFSNTFLEAWSMGTPVITHQTINPDQIISDYQLGIVVKNLTEYIQAVKKIKVKKGYNELSRKCISYVNTNHDAELISNELVKVIRERYY